MFPSKDLKAHYQKTNAKFLNHFKSHPRQLTLPRKSHDIDFSSQGNLRLRCSFILLVADSDGATFCCVIAPALRRLRTDLACCFKIFQLSYPFRSKQSLLDLIYTSIASSRSHSSYSRKPAKATNKVLSMLNFRKCDEAWNALPASLRLSSSLPALKHGLKSIDLSRFLKGPTVILFNV
jgi:hypothetical protein